MISSGKCFLFRNEKEFDKGLEGLGSRLENMIVSFLRLGCIINIIVKYKVYLFLRISTTSLCSLLPLPYCTSENDLRTTHMNLTSYAFEYDHFQRVIIAVVGLAAPAYSEFAAFIGRWGNRPDTT